MRFLWLVDAARSSRSSMTKLSLVIAAAMASLGLSPASAAPEPSARRLVESTLNRLGAGRDIASVHSLSEEGREIAFDLVENDHPMTAPFYVPAVSNLTRQEDFDRNIQHVVTEARGGSTTTLISDSVAVTMAGTGASASRRVNTASPAWGIRNPIAALRRALTADDLRTEPDTIWHGSAQHVVSFHLGRYPVRIYIGAATGLPSATEAVVTFDDQHLSEAIAWNALGDVTDRTEYINWSVVDGIRYPLQRDTLRDGQIIRTTIVSKVTLDQPVDSAGLALKPGEAFAAASVQDFRPDQKVPGPYPDKPIAEIAPGIVQIPNSWYSTIVRQNDGLVIIDAPISAGYAKGILAAAERRFPGIPVKALITSTGFFWHVAGVREFAARGIPIYAERRNVLVIERMLNAPHKLAPDSLSRNPRAKPKVIAVSSGTLIGSGANALELYPVAEGTQPMLMTYMRDSKILHTGEMVQPLGPNGSILFPESLIELVHSVTAQKLKVDRMIGMHMSPTPWSAIAETLKAAHAAA